MIKKILTLLFVLGLTINAYAAREYAQRYPTGTALEVYTPNNPPTPVAETDPVYSAWDKSTGISITESQISDFGTYLTAESDPYAVLLAGRSGGQTIKGGTGEGEDLSFWTNATGTVGSYFFTDLTDNGFVKTSGGTGLLSIDTNTYLTSEVDGSVTNELPIAGNLIDISGTPASTVDVDLTEAGDLTWGSGSASTMVHTYNLSGTDVTVTFASNKITFSGDLEVVGDLYVNDIYIDNYLATALTVGANGVGGTEGIITLDNGANPGTTATLSYTKWADLEAVTGIVKCNGSGDYSAAGAGDIPDLSATYLPLHSTADAVTNATLTTALTVNTGTLTLTANADNTSVLTIGSGAVSVSGSNTGDQTNISGNAATVTNGVYTTDIGSSVQAYNAYLTTGTIGITIDGGGSAITTGSKGFIYVPYACTISSATLLADQSGSIVIDVKKVAYGSFPTTSSITASAKPTLSSAQNSQDTTLTGWTTSVSAGDVLEFVVDSCTTTTRANLILKVAK
jgi:hypothetical protein